ncbi:unnamed protein product [Adineta steineri]|uniref:Uncharacterized protein n=1 Tax=Adineta steineri TaxID=433720 RepID=A0A820ATU9_9BILA
MKLFSIIIIVVLCLVMLVQQGFAGPVAGGICCTGCCAPLGAGAAACIPLCVATLGGMPPCTFCAAMFLAPTP